MSLFTYKSWVRKKLQYYHHFPENMRRWKIMASVRYFPIVLQFCNVLQHYGVLAHIVYGPKQFHSWAPKFRTFCVNIQVATLRIQVEFSSEMVITPWNYMVPSVSISHPAKIQFWVIWFMSISTSVSICMYVYVCNIYIYLYAWMCMFNVCMYVCMYVCVFMYKCI
jgi:hypothetical protein